ncbi:MAG: hypothetical protein Kilf2KO_39390 [Rhodospirillales bacterium]
MSHVKKGQLTASGEWRKHLRPDCKRFFWKGERAAEAAELSDRLSDVQGASTVQH